MVQESTRKYRAFRYGAALSLVVVMALCAEHFGENEIIFPEILALAVGGWVAEKCPWQTSRFNLWLAPTTAALFGVLLMRYSRSTAWIMVGLAFLFVALLLTATRSTLAPSISAAILPILIGTTSWIYPLSVCILTALIALNIPWLERFTREPGRAVLPADRPPALSLGKEMLFWGRLLIVLMAAALVALKSDHIFLIAPPLIVTFVEFSHRESPLRSCPVKIFALLGFAAWIGMLSYSVLSLQWGCPLWVSSACTTAVLFTVYEAAGMLFPPAAAIALLPTILPPEQLPRYPWQVMAGAALFLTTSFLLFGPVRKRLERERPTR
jgi:hypothetical protein